MTLMLFAKERLVQSLHMLSAGPIHHGCTLPTYTVLRTMYTVYMSWSVLIENGLPIIHMYISISC